jgi:hypothetical protein
MIPRLDQELDELLGRHLAGRLDPELGRAATAFRAALTTSVSRPGRRRLLLWGAGAALAAGLAVAWVMSGARDVRSPHTSPPPSLALQSTEPPALPVVQSTTWTPVTDDGTALLDDQPVRQLRRRIVDQFEWYDARSNATVRRVIPREQFILIGVQTD